MRKVKVALVAVMFFPLLGWAQTKKPALPAGGKSALQASMNRGKLVYGVSCLSCHQADGFGVGNLNPPLVKTQWVLGSKNTLIDLVLRGSQGQVEIDGDRFYNTMPSHTALTDQQLADVLTYVRNSFGNKASPVTPAEVKVVRAKIK